MAAHRSAVMRPAITRGMLAHRGRRSVPVGLRPAGTGCALPRDGGDDDQIDFLDIVVLPGPPRPDTGAVERVDALAQAPGRHSYPDARPDSTDEGHRLDPSRATPVPTT